jgi:hypothetical protein
MKNSMIVLILFLVGALFMACPSVLTAQSALEKTLSRGESVYVSIYSNVYSGPKGSPYQLSAMLSIRNTDPSYGITIMSADYYDNNGKLIERYITGPISLKPLASKDFLIKEHDTRGGVGANFIVRWQSDKMVNQPIIEGIMLGLSRGQGISFICPGQILAGHSK